MTKLRIPTEQEISKKHNVSIDYVTRQAEIGSTIEREHTTSHEEAYGIALQHIAEFPNYYSHLLKMEKKLKKEWGNGKKAVKEEKEEVRYCHLCQKPETKSECSYGPSAWEMNTRLLKMQEDHKEIASGKMKDHEGYMANLELDQMERSIAMLRKVIRKSNQQLPAWVQSKITRAADFVDTAAEYLSSDESLDEGVLSKIVDRLKNRVDTGERTGSGGKVYMTRKPTPSKAKYKSTTKPVSKSKDSDEDPWLKGAKSSGGAELKAHYRQLRGEQKSFNDFMSEATNVSFEIGSGHKVAQRQAKIRNLADRTTSAGEESAAKSKLKGPDWKKPKLNTEGAAWTRKEGQNKNGGLNEKGRKSYEAENPGSDLKAPQPEGGPRKKSFCARMSGNPGPMKDEKGRPTRKALALRKWKC